MIKSILQIARNHDKKREMTTWREIQPFIKDQNLLQINQNKQTKSKVYTMKLINTLAVIAATMVALPQTGAIKLKQDVEVDDLAQ